MTRMRCPHLSITALWWSHKQPINWGMPANDNFGYCADHELMSTIDLFSDVDIFNFTTTEGKR